MHRIAAVVAGLSLAFVGTSASFGGTDQLPSATVEFIDTGQEIGVTSYIPFPQYSSSKSVAVGDLNNDGYVDAIFANTNDPSTIWLNDVFGVLEQSQELPTDANWNLDVALGDLDNDGDLDAVFAARENPGTVWFNDSNGNFEDSGQQITNTWAYCVALADLNNDGYLDAVYGNQGSNTVYLNDGDGGLIYSGGLGNGWSWGVALGDLDNDGDPDAIFANWNNQPNTVWINNGDGDFENTQSFGNSASCAVSMGDLNGDGYLDAVIANDNALPNTVWINNGSGTLIQSEQDLGEELSRDVALADMNGDGDLDAVFANSNDWPNTCWLNDGTGLFTETGSINGIPNGWGSGQDNTYSIAVGHILPDYSGGFNPDPEYPDVIVANDFDNPSRLYGPVVQGACCINDTCIQLQYGYCVGANAGVYIGGNCPDVTCDDLLAGACCVTSGCSAITETECTELGGTWLGEDGSCDDCAATCQGDANADGVVDVFDLLKVIEGWGTCP